MKDCIFCKIIAGEMPAYKIYEDDFCLAFLDIAKEGYGHTLVIPKKHYENVSTCDSTTLGRVMDVCKKVGNHYCKDCGFEGYNIFNNTGTVAGAVVPHLHFHLVPRKKDDGIWLISKLDSDKAELEDVQKALKFEEKKTAPHENVSADTVVLYTDGACSGNPGAGGWSAILSYKGREKILSGGEKETTNNRMELMSVIVGLENIKKGSKVSVFSDSAYVVNAFNQNWIGKWRENHWRTSAGSEVSNKELWLRLLAVVGDLDVEFVKVKGHSDNENNNRCDALARAEIAKLSEE
jgi:ribonuclease HI